MRLLDMVRYVLILIYQRIIYPLFFNRGAQIHPMTVTANTSSSTISGGNSPFKPSVTTSLQPPSNTAAASTSSSSFSRFFSSAFSSSPYGNQSNTSLLVLNNMLNWFYSHMDTSHRINQTILNILNFNFSSNGQRPMSVRLILIFDL